MKAIKLFLISIFVLAGSTAQAGEEYIGPAFRVDEGNSCYITAPGYEYSGTSWVQYSNGKKGHATFKCKLDLTDGEGVISYFEFASTVEDFPIPGSCFNTVSLEGEKGTWTSQCFGAWESGD